MNRLFISLLVMLSLNSFAQINIDSLKTIWENNSIHDTVRLDALHKIAWDGYRFSNPDSSLYFAELMHNYAFEKELSKWVNIATCVKGYGYYYKGDYGKSLEAYSHCLALSDSINDLKSRAAALNGIGLIYQDQGDFKQAKDYHIKSLNLRSDIGDRAGVAASLNNLGILFITYGDSKSAIKYIEESLRIRKELGLKREIAASLNNLGGLYQEQNNFDTAISNYFKSVKIKEQIGDFLGMASSFINISIMYYDQEKFEKSIECSERALEIAQEIGVAVEQRNAAFTLHKIYTKLGEHEKALNMYKHYILMRDKIQSDEVREEMAMQEAQHELEKSELLRKQRLREEKRIEDERTSKRNQLQYLGIGIGLFALFGLIFVIGRFALPKWVLELSVFLPFLIFFEFLLVITDPLVDFVTKGEPLFKLLINVLMAGAIFPLHSFFERHLKSKVFKGIRKSLKSR